MNKSYIYLLVLLFFTFNFVFAQEGNYPSNSSVVNLVNEGIELHKNKDYAGAIKVFEEALLIEPNNTLVKQNLSIAHNNYAKYLAERTDYQKALNEFRRALYYDPKNNTADANLDAVLSQQGVKANDSNARIQLGDKLRADAEFELALIEYKKAESLSKTPNSNIYISIGDIYYILYLREGQKTDDINKAIDSYKKALEITETAKAHIKIGDGLLGLRDVVSAIDHYKKALLLEPDSPDVLAANVRGWNEAVRLAPLVAENHIGLAQALQQKSDFINAEEEYNQAIKLDPGSEVATRGLESLEKDKLKSKAIMHLNSAIKLQAEGKYNEAIAEYVNAIEISPDDPKLHYNIGTAFQAVGDNEHAEKAYRKALLIDKDNEKAKLALENLKNEADLKKVQDLTKKALEIQNAGDYQGAITSYLAALSIKPNDPQLYYNLGTAYQASGDLKQAIAQYEKASEIDKNNKSFSDALKFAKEESVRPLIQSAVQKQTSNDLLGAIEDYKKALEVLPDDSQTHFNLGTAYQAGKQLDNAIQSYLQALKIDSKGQVDAYFFLGSIYEEKKDKQLATQNYQEYLKNAPSGTYAKEAKDIINYLKIQP